MPRFVRDRQRRPCFHQRRLWRDAAGPEDRDLAGVEVYGFAVVGLRQVADADRGGVAEVDWWTVGAAEARANARGGYCLGWRQRAHRDDERAAEAAHWLASDVGAIHRHVAVQLDVPHR